MILAVLHWGPSWRDGNSGHATRVCFWIDNASAVSWVNKRPSPNDEGRVLNCLLSLAELQYSLICTARHVPSVDEVTVDAGSRAWSTTHPLYSVWTDLSYTWSQV